MKKIKYITSVALLFVMALFSCSDKEALETEVLLEADKKVVKVGETVTFTVKHNASHLSLYTGESGSDYLTSANYLLKGKTNEELQNEVFRPSNPNIKPFVCNLSDTEAGAPSVVDNLVDYWSLDGAGSSLIGINANIVNDDSIKKNALKVFLQYPQYWSHGPRFNINSGVGENKKLTLRMRFEKDHLTNIDTGTPNTTVKTFSALISLGGIAEGSSEVIYKDPWSEVKWGPTKFYADYTCDIGSTVNEWENQVGKKMKTLSYIMLRFVALGNVGYVGDYYVESVKFGSKEYYPFSVGKSLPVYNDAGITTYKHQYMEPGTYNAIVIGNNISFKNYSGNGNKVDGIDADEYNYSSKQSTVKIVVEP